MSEQTQENRSPVDVFLRVALTLVVLVVVGTVLRLFFLIHGLSSSNVAHPSHASATGWNAEAARRAEVADQRARFPLPLFPGAQEPEFGEMEFNGRPFARCDYDVSASPRDVLSFYRDQLAVRGWKDITEDFIRQSSVVQDGEGVGFLDFQNEQFLRFYDHMMNTQATFSRDGGHVQIAVEPGELPWMTRVGVMYVQYGSPEQLSSDLLNTLTGGGRDQPDAGPATFAQNLGDQRAETTILTSRLPPGDYRDDLLLHYRETGWTDLAPPSPVGANTPLTGSLIKGDQMVFLNVTFDPAHEVSRAVITTMGPR
jgi:hypothetical protein